MNKKRLPCGKAAPEARVAPTPTKLGEYQERLKNYLSQAGLKYTDQRWMIAQTILKTGGHREAQDIVDLVKKSHPAIGAATVYRSIKVLCDAGLLEPSHHNVQGRVFYELPDDDHHDHIICMDCGEVFEFHNDAIEKLQDDVSQAFGFKTAGHKHVIHGHCDLIKTRKG